MMMRIDFLMSGEILSPDVLILRVTSFDLEIH